MGKKTRKVVQGCFASAPTHESQVAMQTIFDLGLELLEHSPCLSDLFSSDYHDFLQLIQSLKDRTFSFNEKVLEAVKAWFREEDQFFL